jgi:hypothetical protein
MLKIIYPPDYFNTKKVDDMFEKEADAFKDAGFDVHVWNLRSIPSGEYLYRGWMLSEKEYAELDYFMTEHNAKLLTSPEDYLNAHYLKNWYEKLDGLTPKTIFATVENINTVLDESNWTKFFVKDYVKSLTTTNGSIANSKQEVLEIINELNRKRGITGGISLREVHEFVPDSEIRYFCINGTILSPAGAVPDIVNAVKEKVRLPFYSIDVIQDVNGKEWIVEIGDGQVSDLKLPWKPIDFVNAIKESQKKKIKYKP